MRINIWSAVAYFFDMLMFVWFFRGVETKEGKWYVKLAGALALLAQASIYMRMLSLLAFKYALRLVSFTAFLALWKGLKPERAVYFSILFISVLTGLQTLSPIVGTLFSHAPQWLVTLAFDAAKFGCVTLISGIAPLERMRKFRLLQWIVSVCVAFLLVYSKQVMSGFIGRGADLASTVRWYPAVVLLLSLLLLSGFDYFFVLRDEQKAGAVIAIGREYQYKNMERRLSAEQETRRLQHDLKNHLLALRSVSPEEQNEYINEMLERVERLQTTVETGNAALNGLLGGKLETAQKKKIRMTADIELSKADFMNPVDICAIFGNAVDNAIEAAERVRPEEERFVRIRGGFFAHQLSISITNSCGDVPERDEFELLRTTKEDKAGHGLGMASMRAALERYGGTFTYGLRDEGVFGLYILIPIP